ncbi:MAG: hypothetical protein V1870_01265 [Candidatus Aenigmatarchaeota archaeon]
MRKGYIAMVLLAGIALLSSYYAFFDRSGSVKKYSPETPKSIKRVYHNNKSDIRAILVSGPGSDVDEQRFRMSNDFAEKYLKSIGVNEIYSYHYDSKNPEKLSGELLGKMRDVLSVAEDHDVTLITFASHGNGEGIILSKKENNKYGMSYDKLASILDDIDGYKIAIIQACNADALVENMFTYGKYSVFGKDCKLPHNSVVLAAASDSNRNEQTTFCAGNESDYIPRFLKALKEYHNVEKAFKESWNSSDRPTMHTSVPNMKELNGILNNKN